MKQIIDLKNWQFEIKALNFKKEVSLPHTWNVDEITEVQLYRGKAEYSTEVKIEKSFKKAVLYFGCAYHNASVLINGKSAGVHSGSGYTPFEFEVTKLLKDGENSIVVTVDNEPTENMLPHSLDYDWADDGGLTRDVKLYLYEEKDIVNVDFSYTLTDIHGGLCDGELTISADTPSQCGKVEISEYKTEKTVLCLDWDFTDKKKIQFENLKFWDTATPNLYNIKVTGENDSYTVRTGFRQIKVEGTSVLLNGRKLFLKGCEWMPGSHPDYGMAEPFEHSQMRIKQLVDAGCEFTRFHWQQDSSVFALCDEYGLLVQEEIPYWGHPKKATDLQLEIAKNQATEMVKYHSHHPSIVCWGVGNELGGEFSETIDYVKKMYAFFKELDPSRLVNYVSNSVCRDTNVDLDDATLYGDIAMWNEYLGLWQPCDDVKGVILRTYNKFGEMPSMVTEFGLCEPAFSGGDERRCEILKERIPIYKELPNMAGYVWFSLNDYRTQCGEAGEGRLKQRVHGSTDLYGNEKPSYRLFCKI